MVTVKRLVAESPWLLAAQRSERTSVRRNGRIIAATQPVTEIMEIKKSSLGKYEDEN